MKDTYYAVHSFMIDDLELRGTQLSVYALIYSFTISENNYFGSLEYISKRVGSSLTSVKAALKILLERSLIIKRTSKKTRTNIYVANLDILKERVNERSEIDRSKTDYVDGQKVTGEQSDSDYNNKYIKNEIPTKHNTFIQGDRKSAMSYLGQSRVVVMTLHQYVNLLRAIGILPTLHYIRVLEKIILSKPKGARWNHYGTIIKWARQDGLVDETSEMILSN